MSIVLLVFIIVGLLNLGGEVEHVGASPSPSIKSSQGQSVFPGDFQRILLAEIKRQFGRRGQDLHLTVLFPKQPLSIPSGKSQFEVAPITDGGRTGRRAFRVSLFVNGKFIRTVNIVAELKAKARVVIPSRWIQAHEVIQSKDVTSAVVNLPSLTHDFFLNARLVLGKQVLRPLPPRQPIRKLALEDPPQIKKGDRVMIEVRQGGLLVQTVGLAKAEGKTGETIPIKNQNSGREVLGRVVSAGLVQVGF